MGYRLAFTALVLIVLTLPAHATPDPAGPGPRSTQPPDPTRLALARNLFTAAKLDDEVKSTAAETFGRPASPSGEDMISDPHAMTKSLQLNDSVRAGLDKIAPQIVDDAVPVLPAHMTDTDMAAALTYFQGPAAKALNEASNQASMAGLAGIFTRMGAMMTATLKDYCGRVTCTDADQRRFAAMKNLFGGGNSDGAAPAASVDPERLALAKAYFAATHEDADLKAALDRQVAETFQKLTGGGAGATKTWTIQDSAAVAMKSMGSDLLDDDVAAFAKAAKPSDIQAALNFYGSPAGASFLAAEDAVKAATLVLTVQDLPKIYAAIEADYCAQMVCAAADRNNFQAMLAASRKALAAQSGAK
jgi:hypothetical protein